MSKPMIDNLVAFSVFTALVMGFCVGETFAGGSECVNGIGRPG